MSMFKLQLKEMRKRSGLTQREAADKAGVSLGTYRTWEQGTSGMSLESAFHCAVALGCTPNDLCGWYEDHPREAAPRMPPDVSELVGCYQGCTRDRRMSILNLARDAALASGEVGSVLPAAEVGEA